jgi:hypothetical protein
MPRAHRHFLPNHVWHITHRCHQQAFLLKFARDRGRYTLREPGSNYAHGLDGKNSVLRPDNAIPRNESAEVTEA